MSVEVLRFYELTLDAQGNGNRILRINEPVEGDIDPEDLREALKAIIESSEIFDDKKGKATKVLRFRKVITTKTDYDITGTDGP